MKPNTVESGRTMSYIAGKSHLHCIDDKCETCQSVAKQNHFKVQKLSGLIDSCSPGRGLDDIGIGNLAEPLKLVCLRRRGLENIRIRALTVKWTAFAILPFRHTRYFAQRPTKRPTQGRTRIKRQSQRCFHHKFKTIADNRPVEFTHRRHATSPDANVPALS